MKHSFKFTFFILFFIFFLVGCDKPTLPPPGDIDNPLQEEVVEIKANEARINIKNEIIKSYDFTKLFTITVDGKEIDVLEKYIDLSNLSLSEGTYKISCNYKGKSASVDVNVISVKYNVINTVNEIILKDEKVENYDFTKLFKIFKDNEEIEVLSSYLDLAQLRNIPGEYNVSCSYNNCVSNIKVIVTKTNYEIIQNVKKLEINDEDILTYDFTELFSILKDGNNIEVKDEYIDKSLIKNEVGTYFVICKYKDLISKLNVIVKETKYEIKLDKEIIEVKLNEVDTYDFLKHFKLYREDELLNITSDMIVNEVKKEMGSYSFSVVFKDYTKTLLVNVVENHHIDIVKAYKQLELTISELNDYNYLQLFNLYVDYKINAIDESMITYDYSNVSVGDSFDVKLNYEIEGIMKSDTVVIKVVNDDIYKVNTKEITIYPNSSKVLLSDLFEVYRRDEKLVINENNIQGSIDYANIGDYEIKLSFNDNIYTSIVHVKFGVQIEYLNSDTVLVSQGTNINTYSFNNDFLVLINGIRYYDFPNYYVDYSNADFNTLGTYDVVLKIPYNDKTLGLAGVSFTYYEKTIKYQVVPIKYTLNIKEDVLLISSEQDILDNVEIKLNNLRVSLTTNRNWVSDITVYAELSQLINDKKMHEVTIKIYLFGLDSDPIETHFTYYFEDSVKLEAHNKSIYSGDTIFLTDLFSIIDNGEEIDVKNEMIEGIVDFFNIGTYNLTLKYKEHTIEASVTILDANMKGTYYTILRTIEEKTDYGDDGEEITNPSHTIGNFIIDDEGNYHFDNSNIQVIESISQNILKISIAKNVYLMYYDNGIIVLNPVNEHKMAFSNYSRPLIFFNKAMYKVTNLFTINSSSLGYIIGLTNRAYSIDTFQVENINTNETFNYALKVELIDRTSADTVYDVTWGICSFNEGFTNIDAKGTLTFMNDDYPFITQDVKTGLIEKNISEEKKYSNISFTNVYDNVLYTLSGSSMGSFTFKIGTSIKTIISSSEINSLANGYIDYNTDTIFVYGINHVTYGTYSYKFQLDISNKILNIVPKDNYYGLYYNGNDYIFIDGYGTGIYHNLNGDFKFEYQVINNQMILSFDKNYGFGNEVTLLLSDLYNVLTVVSTEDKSLINKSFENQYIVIGGIVHFDQLYFYGTPSAEKELLINSIEIITKDGVLNYNQKIGKIPGTNTNYIVTNKIRFGTAGFYELTINIQVGDTIVSQVYAIEILKEVYKDSDLPGNYGFGLNNKNIYLNLSSFGVGILTIDNEEYKGLYIIDDNEFILRAYSINNALVTVSGSKVADGLVYVRATGSALFNDYFSNGISEMTGNVNYKLRRFNINNDFIYLISKSTTSQGEIVEVKIENDIYYVNYDNKELCFMVKSWSNSTSGLIEPDIYRNTYLNGDSVLEVDGFGKVDFNGNKGTYEAFIFNSLPYLTIQVNNEVFLVNLEPSVLTFTIVNKTFDQKLVANKTYKADYTFICEDEEYEVSTSFAFTNDGKVIITSTSTSHDSSCNYDRYEPGFVTVNGTYSVVGNVLTIVSGEFIFSFKIDNLMNSMYLITTSTNYDSDDHGYFKVGVIFSNIL